MVAVFRKAFRDSRKMIFWLSIANIAYALLVISFYPTMKTQREGINKMIQSYPKEMITMFYGDIDVESLDLTEPAGYIHSQFALWMLLLFGVITMVQAFNAFTNSERDGTLDLMLSLPVSRRQYLLARVGNTVVTTLALLTSCFIGLCAARLIWPELELSIGDIALAVYGAFLPIMVVGCFTYWLVTFVPSRKKFVGGIVYLLFFGTYLLYGLSGASHILRDLQPYMLFDYYSATDLIHNGIDPFKWLVLLVTILVFFSLAWWSVDRKELGV